MVPVDVIVFNALRVECIAHAHVCLPVAMHHSSNYAECSCIGVGEGQCMCLHGAPSHVKAVILSKTPLLHPNAQVLPLPLGWAQPLMCSVRRAGGR
jgi:hypothetical protein